VPTYVDRRLAQRPALRDRDADMSAVPSSSIAASRVARSTPRRRSLPRASSGSDVDALATSAKMDKERKGESDYGSILNWRDLASTPGTRVAPGRVFRTATPGKSTEEDAATIVGPSVSVARLLDLRSVDEFEETPGALQSRFQLRTFTRDPSTGTPSTSAAIAAFRASILDDVDAGRKVRYHAPLLDYDRYYRSIYERMEGLERVKAVAYGVQAKLYDDTNQRRLFVRKVNAGGLRLLNEVMVDGSGPEIAAALCVLSASSADDGATAFYCKAGKDRTGLVAALALHCCGASDDAIVADYTRSQGSGKAALGGGKVEGDETSIDYSRFHGAPEAIMRHTLSYVRRRYGSVEGYLDRVGFDADARRTLARALCE